MIYERIPERVMAMPVHEIEYLHRMGRIQYAPDGIKNGLSDNKLGFYENQLFIRTPLGSRDHYGICYLVHSLDNDEWFFVVASDFNRNFRKT